MARQRFPLVDILIGETAGGGVMGQPALLTDGLVLDLFADEACTTPLDATTVGGTIITTVTVQGASIPPFMGPITGERIVYARPQGATGPGIALVAVNGAQDPVSGGGGYTGWVHTQATPSAAWNIAHGLNRRPWPTVILTGDSGRASIPDVVYSDANHTLLEFPSPVTGTAEF